MEQQSASHQATAQRMQRASLGQQMTVGVSSTPRSAFQTSISPLVIAELSNAFNKDTGKKR